MSEGNRKWRKDWNSDGRKVGFRRNVEGDRIEERMEEEIDEIIRGWEINGYGDWRNEGKEEER